MPRPPGLARPPPALGRPARRWRLALGWALALLLTAGLLLAGAVAWYAPQLPPLDRVTRYQPRQPLQVVTADGVEIAQFGAERRQFVPISAIPLQLQQALLAVEDARFRQHLGIDPKGMLRALLAAATGGLRQGASTITQQVALVFLVLALHGQAQIERGAAGAQRAASALARRARGRDGTPAGGGPVW